MKIVDGTLGTFYDADIAVASQINAIIFSKLNFKEKAKYEQISTLLCPVRLSNEFNKTTT